MDRERVLEALKEMRNRKRNFTQTVELLIGLKDLDLKRPEHQLDFFVTLPHGTGKKLKICALAAQELAPEAKAVCDTVILQDDFQKYVKDKKALKKLVREHAYFIGQANIMPQIATAFGRILGPRGKMPNPKAGGIVPPKASLKPLYGRLQKTIRVSAKASPVIQCRIGAEGMDDGQIADNFNAVYDQVSQALPNGEGNIKSAFIKLTMGRPVRVLAKRSEGESRARVRTR